MRIVSIGYGEPSAFLKAHGTGDCVFTRIQSLGGYPAAKAMYEKQAA